MCRTSAGSGLSLNLKIAAIDFRSSSLAKLRNLVAVYPIEGVISVHSYSLAELRCNLRVVPLFN